MSINLLPWRELKIQLQWRKMVIRWVFYFFSLIMLAVITKHFLEYKTNCEKNKKEVIENQIKLIAIDPDFKKKKLFLRALKKSRSLKIKTLKNNQQFEEVLSAIANQLPNSVILNTILIVKNKMTLSGYSQNITDIHQYYQNLLALKLCKQITLSDIQADSTKISTFKFTIEMTSCT